MNSRQVTALVGLVASIAISVAVWYYYGTLFVFLFVPFVPFLLGGRGERASRAPPVRACPRCGFETRNPEYEYCPRDGARLDRTAAHERGLRPPN